MKVLGLIPARGGSKGIRRKNITQLLGKTLVGWSIEQAMRSNYIDTVFVSTEDAEIASISRAQGVEVPFMRPPEFAQDGSPTSDAVVHALETFAARGLHYDVVSVLEPTSPLRKRGQIDEAIARLIDNRNVADAVVSVGLVHTENPYICKVLDGEFIRPFLKAKELAIHQRQQLPQVYFPYGVIYVSKVSTYLESRTFYQDRTLHYRIERWQTYEIDDLCDLQAVEAVMKPRLGEIE